MTQEELINNNETIINYLNDSLNIKRDSFYNYITQFANLTIEEKYKLCLKNKFLKQEYGLLIFNHPKILEYKQDRNIGQDFFQMIVNKSDDINSIDLIDMIEYFHNEYEENVLIFKDKNFEIFLPKNEMLDYLMLFCVTYKVGSFYFD